MRLLTPLRISGLQCLLLAQVGRGMKNSTLCQNSRIWINRLSDKALNLDILPSGRGEYHCR